MAVDFRVAHYKAQIDTNTKMFDSVLDYGKHALNAATIINAGAAVALLTLIGHLSPPAMFMNLAPRFADALLFYVCGVLSGTMASGGAYCTQYFYSQTPEAKTGKIFHIVTVVLGIASYALFLTGGLAAYFILKS